MQARRRASHSIDERGVAPFSGSSAGACLPVVSRHLIGRRLAAGAQNKGRRIASREKKQRHC